MANEAAKCKFANNRPFEAGTYVCEAN